MENENNTQQTTGSSEGTNQQQTSVQSTQTSASANQTQPDKPIFTQSDLNSIVRDRVNSLNSKINSLNEQIKELQGKNEGLTAQIAGYQNKEIAKSENIPDQFVDFAVFEAQKLISASDGKKSMADAMKEIAKTNSSLFGIQTDAANGKNTQQFGNPNQTQGMNQLQKGNSSTQGGNNAGQAAIDAEVQAFLDKKFGKRR